MSVESLDIGYHRGVAGTLNLSSSLQASTPLSNCMWDCDLLLGPPPDLFVSGIPPPPPIPVFLRDPVEYLAAANGSCDLCRWAAGEDVQFVEVTRKYPVVDDVWYFVIVSAVIGAILFAILFVIAMLRCKEAKVKPLHDACSTSKVVEKVRPSRDVPPLGMPCPPPPGATVVPPCCGPAPKALWSALKSDGGYSLHHQPITPELLSCNYERINYGTIGQNTFGPPPARSLPPPPPLLPPPPLPPCRPFAYCTTSSLSQARRPHHHVTVPSAIDEHGNVHIMGNGNAYYANPDSLDGYFENGGYVDSECSLEVRKVAPDGAVVSRRGSSAKGSAGGGCGLGGWDEAILRQRVEAIPGAGGMPQPPLTSSFRGDKILMGRHNYILPPPGSRLNVSTKVSSPLV